MALQYDPVSGTTYDDGLDALGGADGVDTSPMADSSDDWSNITWDDSWATDPGFQQWLSGLDSGGVGTDTPATTITGYNPDGTPVYADSEAPSTIDWSSFNSALAGLGTGISGGLSSLGGGLGSFGTALGGLLTQQNTANQTLAQQQAAAQQSSGLASMLGTAGNLYGGYLNTQAAKEAAQTQAQAQIQAAQIAAEASKFRPVGVTTSFGSSNFGFDDQGRLNQAGYTLTPEMKAQQQALMGISQGALDQYGRAQAATAPMAQGAQSMFNLGQQYLGTDPQVQAQKYMADQQALLSDPRAREMANLQAQMQAQGRGGFAIGGSPGMGASNPQLQALLNANRQQDLGLAAQATQGGMDYAKFGAGMMGLGGGMLKDMYGTQQSAYQPYSQAFQGVLGIENTGQNALTLGMDMGSAATAANSKAGVLLGQGMTNAASTVGSVDTRAGSTWGNLLSDLSSANVWGK